MLTSNICGAWYPCLVPVIELESKTKEASDTKLEGQKSNTTLNSIPLDVYFSYLTSQELAAISRINRPWHTRAVAMEQQRSSASSRLFASIVHLEMQSAQVSTYRRASNRSFSHLQSIRHILDALHCIKHQTLINVSEHVTLSQLQFLMHIMKYTEMPMHFEIFPELIASLFHHATHRDCPNPLESVLVELEACDDKLQARPHATQAKIRRIIWV